MTSTVRVGCPAAGRPRSRRWCGARARSAGPGPTYRGPRGWSGPRPAAPAGAATTTGTADDGGQRRRAAAATWAGSTAGKGVRPAGGKGDRSARPPLAWTRPSATAASQPCAGRQRAATSSGRSRRRWPGCRGCAAGPRRTARRRTAARGPRPTGRAPGRPAPRAGSGRRRGGRRAPGCAPRGPGSRGARPTSGSVRRRAGTVRAGSRRGRPGRRRRRPGRPPARRRAPRGSISSHSVRQEPRSCSIPAGPAEAGTRAGAPRRRRTCRGAPGRQLQRLDRTHHPDRQHPELGGHRVVQVAEVQVLAGHQHHPERQPRLLKGREHPALVRPDDVLLRVGAAPAVDAALAGAGRLGQGQRVVSGLTRSESGSNGKMSHIDWSGSGSRRSASACRDGPIVEVLRRRDAHRRDPMPANS